MLLCLIVQSQRLSSKYFSAAYWLVLKKYNFGNFDNSEILFANAGISAILLIRALLQFYGTFPAFNALLTL
jgi:hypothetical protein